MVLENNNKHRRISTDSEEIKLLDRRLIGECWVGERLNWPPSSGRQQQVDKHRFKTFYWFLHHYLKLFLLNRFKIGWQVLESYIFNSKIYIFIFELDKGNDFVPQTQIFLSIYLSNVLQSNYTGLTNAHKT